MLKKTLSAITALFIMTNGLGAETNHKDIRVQIRHSITEEQDITPPSSTEEFDDTISYASGVKNHYQMDQPIEIKVKLKRDAYVYLWSISSSGQGCLILPNHLGEEKLLSANKKHIIPEDTSEYEFVSDRAGVEKIYILATNKILDTDKVKEIFDQKIGGYSIASQKSIQKFITKDIKVIARKKKMKYDIQSFQIQID